MNQKTNAAKFIAPTAHLTSEFDGKGNDFARQYQNKPELLKICRAFINESKSAGIIASETGIELERVKTIIDKLKDEGILKLWGKMKCPISGRNSYFYALDHASDTMLSEEEEKDNRTTSNVTPNSILEDVKRLEVNLIDDNHSKSISTTDLLNRNIESIPCLVEPFLHKFGLAAIVGSSDAGKSAFLRFMCMSIASNQSHLLGFPINAKHHRAIYVSTEDDETSISFLLHKQNKTLNLDPESFSGLSFVFDTDGVLQTLDEILTVSPADIVCVDAFTDLYGKSLNEANQVRTFLNDYSQLAGKHQCLIMFLHHTGKRTDDLEPNKHNVIGSQAFESKSRLIMELRSDNLVEEIKHLCIVKGNYLPATFKEESYVLQFTENMTFINTGRRASFESLSKAKDGDTKKYNLIKSYQAQGLSLSEIAGMDGVGYADRGAVSNFIKRYEKKNCVVSPDVNVVNDNALTTEQEKLPF